ncbi:MFS transporter [Pseudaeromonas paramecii]|uniref:MFS transporter n=1 Tax=Pseudaeromonas paramecii TaxID=2138166 RepID=A0ABP8Q475_9GAMM
MSPFTMNASERRASLGLGLVFALRLFGIFIVLPVLTTYGMALQGATQSLIGLAIGIYGLTQALLQIPFGLLSDKLGRKPVIIGGLLLFALGSLLAGSSDNIWGIIAGRALQGAGAISAAVLALLSDLTREQHRTKAMAFIGVSFGLTFAAAMVLGPLITPHLGLNGLFFAIAVLALLAILITWRLVPAAPAQRRNREANLVTASLGRVLTDPQLMRLNLSIFCLHSLLMASFVALPLMLVDSGVAKEQQWPIYLVTLLVSFVAIVPFILYAEKRHQHKRVLLGAISILLLTELLLWQAQGSLPLLAGIQLFFVAFNLLEALLPSLISKEAPAGYKGTAMGVYSTSQFLGVAVGGALGGRLLDLLGPHAVFVGGVLISLLWLLLASGLRAPASLRTLRLPLPVALDAQQSRVILERLQAQPGVAEVALVSEEASAYLKIDPRQVDRAQLESLLVN